MPTPDTFFSKRTAKEPGLPHHKRKRIACWPYFSGAVSFRVHMIKHGLISMPRDQSHAPSAPRSRSTAATKWLTMQPWEKPRTIWNAVSPDLLTQTPGVPNQQQCPLGQSPACYVLRKSPKSMQASVKKRCNTWWLFWTYLGYMVLFDDKNWLIYISSINLSVRLH